MNFVCIVFELGNKMFTLSAMVNLIVPCNLKPYDPSVWNIQRSHVSLRKSVHFGPYLSIYRRGLWSGWTYTKHG